MSFCTLDTNPTQVNFDRFQISKKELEHIKNEDIKAHIFRSKIKWSEEGERNTSFFLNLEKRIFTNKLISALEINGTIIKDLNKISQNQSVFYETLYSEKINQNNPCYDDNLKMFLQNNSMPKTLWYTERILWKTCITNWNFKKYKIFI